MRHDRKDRAHSRDTSGAISVTPIVRPSRSTSLSCPIATENRDPHRPRCEHAGPGLKPGSREWSAERSRCVEERRHPFRRRVPRDVNADLACLDLRRPRPEIRRRLDARACERRVDAHRAARDERVVARAQRAQDLTRTKRILARSVEEANVRADEVHRPFDAAASAVHFDRDEVNVAREAPSVARRGPEHRAVERASGAVRAAVGLNARRKLRPSPADGKYGAQNAEPGGP